MDKSIKKDNVIKNKKESIKSLNNTFETFINNPNDKYLKKADLIAYWIKQYSKYLVNEESFDYSRIPRFKRGDILKVNFGFNIGSEQGGLHYAVVLDNDNKKSSPVVTVLPLSSGKQEDVYERDVFLGNELYEKLKIKHANLKSEIDEDLTKSLDAVNKIKTIISEVEGKEIEETILEQLDDMFNEAKEKALKMQKDFDTLAIYKKEINKLKIGSIALTGQITTISKMRIYQPKKKSDLLYDIKLSESAMNKINEQLKNLYIFSE